MTLDASAFARAPTRMSLTNLETGQYISAQFNPEQVKEELGVNFNELAILGLSHKPLQYQNTDNLQVTFDLAFDALSTRDIDDTVRAGTSEVAPATPVMEATARARKFLLSLCYPRRGAQGVVDGGPPRVRLFWPELYSFNARIQKVTIEHKRFRWTGASVLFTASLTVKEVLEVRLFSEDVLEHGTMR